MGPRPWKPAEELPAALDRGELSFAVVLAREVAEDRGRPIALDVALRFLPVVAAQEPDCYDAWALRWLARWATESPGNIEQAVDVAASLAALPTEPEAIETIKRTLGSAGTSR